MAILFDVFIGEFVGWALQGAMEVSLYLVTQGEYLFLYSEDFCIILYFELLANNICLVRVYA